MINTSSFQINSLPVDKIWYWTESKTIEDIKLNIAKIIMSLSDRVENIVGKRENAV